MMKHLLIALALFSVVTTTMAQDAYNEAIRMAKAVADDTSRSLSERKIATFKKDALYYLGSKSYKLTPDSSATLLDHQALALFQFINLFQGKLAMSPKKDRQNVINLFKSISLAHPRFHDPNKEMVLAYILHEGYDTKFSLDTDWVAAYNDIRRRMGGK